jgi:predicted aspartyl protease
MNGVRYVPMKINGQELDFIFDTGASSICISTLIEATIVENPQAECLLGQTVLSRFGKYIIDNQKNEIIFE